MTRGLERRTCKLCGDTFHPEQRAKQLKEIGGRFREAELVYCLECANELFRGKIDVTPARVFPSGHGCPLEARGDASEDSGPWGENAIREMERDDDGSA